MTSILILGLQLATKSTVITRECCPPKPKPKSLRQKSQRKSGGQKGHPGSTLEKVAHPDHVQHRHFTPDSSCPGCSHQLGDSSDFDDFQAAALYLGGYQLLPYQRLSELFQAPLSQGTLANIVKRGSPKAASALATIKEALIARPVGHADETGCTLHGQRHWLHVFGTEELTLYHLDAKRGREAMDRMGILPNFRGLLIHDCLGAYFTNKSPETQFRDASPLKSPETEDSVSLQ